jgi:hypothetical protein
MGKTKQRACGYSFSMNPYEIANTWQFLSSKNDNFTSESITEQETLEGY